MHDHVVPGLLSIGFLALVAIMAVESYTMHRSLWIKSAFIALLCLPVFLVMIAFSPDHSFISYVADGAALYWCAYAAPVIALMLACGLWRDRPRHLVESIYPTLTAWVCAFVFGIAMLVLYVVQNQSTGETMADRLISNLVDTFSMAHNLSPDLRLAIAIAALTPLFGAVVAPVLDMLGVHPTAKPH